MTSKTANSQEVAVRGVNKNKRLKLNISTLLMAIFASLFIFPFVWMAATSLKPSEEVFSASTSFTGSRLAWENYEKAVTDIPFLMVIGNSLLVGILGALLTVTVSVLSAYAFSKFRFRFRDPLFLGFIATMVLPQEVLIIPLYLMLYNAGLTDTYFSLIVPLAFGAFGAFLMRQFMLSIPAEYDDAARLDGANSLTILLRIHLPMLRAPLWVLGVFSFVHYWSDFLWPLIVINDANKATIPLGLQMFHSQDATDWGAMMAAAVIAIIPSLFLVTILQKQLEKGNMAGAFGGR